MTTTPDFRSEACLREHIAQTMAFYHPHAIDPAMKEEAIDALESLRDELRSAS